MISTEEKFGRLKDILQQLDSVLVAYSGGTDSAFLLKVCCDILGIRVVAVTATSPTYPSKEKAAAEAVARSLSVRYLVIETRELERPDFVANSPQRCYYCKRELFQELKQVSVAQGMQNVVDGSNWDDLKDHRPGRRAAAELGIRHPLQEAQLTKEEIRDLSRQMGLPTWNKPSLACLASRFPYGIPIDQRSLAIVDEAENFLHSLGISQLRLRHHGKIARIEVEPPDMHLLLEETRRQQVITHLKGLGYLYITLDLAGYRTGSLNEGLDP